MTYSILARDAGTGEMGIACQSHAFAVGSSVPWALPGYGVIATQSMGEPMYGELGLDVLREGLTASEALTALRSVDPHPERRQVGMIDGRGALDAYTGVGCVAAAGHEVGDQCVALANMAASEAVWSGMIAAFEEAEGSLASRLMEALHAAEAAGGDFRGRRSAAVLVVRDRRTGRPWRDQVVDLRVDDSDDPLADLDQLVDRGKRYHRVVTAFELALDGDAPAGMEILDSMDPEDPADEPDFVLWRGTVLALAGRADEAAAVFAALDREAPQFVEAARRFVPAGLVPDPELLVRVLP